ncbi:MAG: hypothetical protein A2293_13815 [Elusimicrobia bacterium RIFOXYB2_FULL_49_7]|nr:MAG: hypothetical protein A2293_13815 [Elusimicrobia bacterium RIFOXYB2_FULL_49_7]
MQQKSGAAAEAMEIVKTAPGEVSFKVLVKALKAAGLDALLNGDGPYTVFAPNDRAFSTIDDLALKRLFANKEELQALISYHIVPGKFSLRELRNRTSLVTLLGRDITIKRGDGFMVDDAKIVQPDIECDNGVIHVIDLVLAPR